MFNIFIINYMTDCSFKNKDSWEGFSMMQHSMEIFTTAADYTTGCLKTTNKVAQNLLRHFAVRVSVDF